MKKYYQGKYTPENPKKYAGNVNEIVYRSGWERQLMIKFDRDRNVVLWNSEGLAIPYRSPLDGALHRYFVDFVIQVRGKDGKDKTWIIEVKPHAQTLMPKQGKKTHRFLSEVATFAVNQSKWTAAAAFAKEQGWEFQVLTEKHHPFV